VWVKIRKEETMLTITNLTVNINDKTILNDFNLTIKEGEVHAIMGMNGTGKSTLVKAISGHFDCQIQKGNITYKNKDLLQMDVSTRANEGIFMSFQNPIEIAGVNNSYFLKTAFNEKRAYKGEEPMDAMEFLKYVKEQTQPFELDKKLLQRDLNEGFSGGEKKKNELLQLLILNPDLIMLDEIDSGLDVDAIKTVANVINSMLDGKKSVLMITHYDRLLELIKPDFVHIIHNGKIAKTGDYTLALELDKKGFEGIGIKDETH
jgi:Fe-S cluster assembly ATP-binding protein